MKNKWMIGLLGLAVLAASASAQVTVRKGGAGAAVGIDVSGVTVSGGAAAQTVRRTFATDLDRTGWMKTAPRNEAQYFARGTVTESGGQLAFTCAVTDAGGHTYLNATYRQSASQPLLLAHQVANDVVVKVTGKPTFLLARLALVGIRGGAKELYIADSSAQDIRQITRDGSIVVKPRWSPDNRFLSYTSYLKKYPDVYTIELATGTRRRVAFFPGVNTGGAISPDGRSMALILSKDGNPDLYVMDLASRRTTRLTHTPRAVEGSPAWSPDGSQIVYVSDTSGTPQLYLIARAPGSAPRRLTRTGTQNVSPDWGPTGLIAYQKLTGGKFQIAVIDPVSGQDRVISPYDASYEDPSWAPDGRHLAVARSVRYSYSVYLLDSMAALGDKPVALTQSGEWTAPAWSR